MLSRWFSRKKATGQTLLIVDDDAAIRQMLTEILGEEGYVIKAASNGKEALELLDKMPLPSAMVLDLMMPDMRGDEFLEKARIRFGRTKLPPVLFLTGSRQGEAAANTVEADDFLPKPFDSESLIEHVQHLIGKRASTPPRWHSR